jgi:hypothetical protein
MKSYFRSQTEKSIEFNTSLLMNLLSATKIIVIDDLHYIESEKSWLAGVLTKLLDNITNIICY